MLATLSWDGDVPPVQTAGLTRRARARFVSGLVFLFSGQSALHWISIWIGILSIVICVCGRLFRIRAE